MLPTIFPDIRDKSVPKFRISSDVESCNCDASRYRSAKTTLKAQKFSKGSEGMRFGRADHGKVSSDYEASKVACPQYSRCGASSVKTHP
jgi:hypothetical protein